MGKKRWSISAKQIAEEEFQKLGRFGVIMGKRITKERGEWSDHLLVKEIYAICGGE